MKSQVICDALNTVNPTPAQRARMRAALEAQLPAEKPPSSGRASAEGIVSALVDDHSRRRGAVCGGAAGYFCPWTDG